jgi:hypothetical protein
VRLFGIDVVRLRNKLTFEAVKMSEDYGMTLIKYGTWNAPGEATAVLLTKQAVYAAKLEEWLYVNVEDKIEEAKARLPPAPDSKSAARREALRETRRQSVQVYTARYFPIVTYTAVSMGVQSPIVVPLPKGWGYALSVRTIWLPFANFSITYINDNDLAIKDGAMNTDSLKIMPLL